MNSNFSDLLKVFDKFQYNQFTIHAVTSTKEAVSQFFTNTLRGAFGYHFKKMHCLTRKQNCVGCIVAQTCPYLQIFETPVPVDSQIMRKYKHAPHPFTLHGIQNGNDITITITFFGLWGKYFPNFFHTFEQIGREGLGKEKIRFKITEVETLGSTIYDGNSFIGKLPQAVNFVENFINSLAPQDNITLKAMQILFLTPLLILKNEKPMSQFEVAIFFEFLYRRMVLLTAFYENIDLSPFHPDQFATLPIFHSSNLKFQPQERFSTRQNRNVKMGGVTGTVILEKVEPFYQMLLHFGSIASVGKGTVFGNGKISLFIAQ